MKKPVLLCVICLVALDAIGFGFAKWSDSVAVEAVAQSGEMKWGFVDVWQLDDGVDWHSEMAGGMLELYQDPEGKDVASTQLELQDTNGDGVYDTLVVTVNNAYPCYYNEVSATVENLGTIPLVIQRPVIWWGSSRQEIEDGIVYYLCSDGSIVRDPGSAPENAVIEVQYQDNIGAQQHPGPENQLQEGFDFHVLQPAAENSTYRFAFTVEGVQWNESPSASGRAG